MSGKTVLVNVRVAEADRDAWKAAAAAAGVSLTEFVKQAVAARTNPAEVPYERPDPTFSGYVSPLRPRGFQPDWKPGAQPGKKG